MLTTEEVLSRWVDRIYPNKEEFLTTLKTRKLKIYLGVDPTGPDLHLGHATNLLLLRHFQQLGHQIIFLIGDATTMIGDPTGRDTSRKPLMHQEALKNAKTYKDQAAKFLKFGLGGARIDFNYRWWGKMGFLEGLVLSNYTTTNQLIERDMFQKRFREGGSVTPAEFLYPFMQGYDSVVLEVDAEVGGTDQTFNMLVGRKLLKKIKNKEKFVITTKLLENPKTGRKLMSKSEGSYIALTLSSGEMFGRIMALPDEVVIPCFELCTEIPTDRIKELRKEIKVNPAQAKRQLAFEVVKLLFEDRRAAAAQEEFLRVFSKGRTPKAVTVWRLDGQKVDLVKLLVEKGIVPSKSEARRLLEQGGITLNDRKLAGPETTLEKGVLRIGRKTFIKVQ